MSSVVETSFIFFLLHTHVVSEQIIYSAFFNLLVSSHLEYQNVTILCRDLEHLDKEIEVSKY